LPAINWFLLLFLASIPVAVKWARLLPLSFLLLGIVWTIHCASGLLQQFVPAEIENKTITVIGRIADLPQHQPHSVRFNFKVVEAFHNKQPVIVPKLVRLSLYGKYRDKPWDPAIGSRWRLEVRLKNPHGFQNPGGFDYEAYLFSRHIRATGYVVSKSRRLYLGQDQHHGFDRLRQRISQRLGATWVDPDQLGLISALAIGDKQGISAKQWKVLRATGTSHLMAISGLHLSLVSGLVYLLARLAWGSFAYGVRRLPAQKFAVIPALISAFVYSGLAGFSIPTQRALVMLASLYLMVLLSRQPFRLQGLALGMLVVLVYDPLSVLSAGFWLSFSAVAIIHFLVTRRPSTGYWVQGLRVQVGISLGLIPLSLLFFQSASLVSPIANLVVIPIYGFVVVPLTLLGVASFAIFPDFIGDGLVHIAATISSLGWHWLVWLSKLSPAALHLGSPTPVLVLLAMGGMALATMPAGTPFRYLGPLLCLPVFWSPASPAVGEFSATLLDVGQGLSLVVRTHEHTLVFDSGARFSDRLNAGEAVVVPYLRQQGVSRIDTMIISHDDNDHFGGLSSVREMIGFDRLVSNVPQALATESCTRGKQWEWDKVQFEILHPGPGAGGGNNNDSCVLMIRSSHNSLLEVNCRPGISSRHIMAAEPPRARLSWTWFDRNGFWCLPVT
jgi:competence protein ComEC